jgi:hypothetical protein
MSTVVIVRAAHVAAAGVMVAVARDGYRRGLVGSLGVGAEHLHQYPYREDRRDYQEAVAEEGVQADGLA